MKFQFRNTRLVSVHGRWMESDGWMDGVGWMDGWMDEWMDGSIDR